MSLTYIRVVNEQLINRSILIDKIDKSQGNSEGYALKAKQKIYVPFLNPADTTVKGYLNLVPTNEVLLAANNGTISGLASAGYITAAAVDAVDIVTPVVTGAVNAAGVTTITGTTFVSLYPDVTKVTFTNLALATQTILEGVFASINPTTITINDVDVTIGVPGVGWKVQVFANSKLSNEFTL